MKKVLALIGPADTKSGYGYRTADLFSAFVELYKDEFDIKFVSRRWGMLPFGALNPDNPNHKFLLDNAVSEEELGTPDIAVQVTIPNEFYKKGKINVGVTAGIETTLCSIPWIEGMNRMDYNLVSSNHSKQTFDRTVYQSNVDPNVTVKVNSKIDVLFEGIDFKKLHTKKRSQKINKMLDELPEEFIFLTFGRWLNGDMFQDRKNIGGTILAYLYAAANMEEDTLLLVKTNDENEMLREEIQRKIEEVKSIFKANNPNSKVGKIKVLKGELTDVELTTLYSHPKVKCMALLTRGEGYGRPFAEFASFGKPVIAPNWSGHIDFLKSDEHPLVSGKLENVHPSVVWKDVIIPDSQWCTADLPNSIGAFFSVRSDYKSHLTRSKKSKQRLLREFSYEEMRKRLKVLFDKNVINAQPITNTIQLPKLKKVK